MSPKKKALLFFQFYTELHCIAAELVDRCDYTVITDRKIGLPVSDKSRHQIVDELLPYSEIRERTEAEVRAKIPALSDFLMENLQELPFGTHHPDETREVVEKFLGRSVADYYCFSTVFSKLSELYDIGCVVLAPPDLSSHRGAISAAKQRAIPTIGIQHGAIFTNDLRAPQACDIVLVADKVGQKILDYSRVAPTLCIPTGMPYARVKSTVEEGEDDRAKVAARRQLDIAEGAEVILLTLSYVSANLELKTSGHFKTLELLCELIKMAAKRRRLGRDTIIIVKPPRVQTYRMQERAIESIAEELGFEGLKVVDGSFHTLMEASDVVIPGLHDSSVFLDAFAAFRSPIRMRQFAELSNPPAETFIAEHCKTVDSYGELEGEICALLDDPKLGLERRRRALAAMKELRPHGAEEGRDAICSLILDAATEGVEYVREKYGKF